MEVKQVFNIPRKNLVVSLGRQSSKLIWQNGSSGMMKFLKYAGVSFILQGPFLKQILLF